MQTICAILERGVEKFPKKIALIYKNRKYTYQDFYHKVLKISSYFASKILVDEKISLLIDNSDLWLLAYFGIVKANCVCQPLSLRSSDEHLLFQINFSHSQYLVTSKKYYLRCKRLVRSSNVKVVTVEEILKLKIDIISREVMPDSNCTLMYTSGTTSRAKAILLKHRIVYNATLNIVDYLKLRSEDIYYQILPLTHSFGLGNIHSTFFVGGTVILSTQILNYKKVLEEVIKYKATFLAAVPITIKLMVENYFPLLIKSDKFLRILCTNTGPMPVNITKKIIEELKNVQFFTYYGLTEASRSTFIYFNLYPDKLASVGKATPNVKIKIIDNIGKEVVAKNVIGQVCVNGKHAIEEYWKCPEANQKNFKDGFLLTGDMGYFDQDGFLYIVGRTDDMLNIAGEKVSLQEVDQVIRDLPFIQDVICLGNPDSVLDYVIHAYVVTVEKNLSVRVLNSLRVKIITHCKKYLDRHKVPRKIIFVDKVFRTESGKIQRQLFKEYIQAENVK